VEKKVGDFPPLIFVLLVINFKTITEKEEVQREKKIKEMNDVFIKY